MKKSQILLIYTGGTIGMKEDSENKSLQPFNFNQITKEVPELKKINCVIDAVSFKKPVDSSEVNYEFWEEIGDNIFDNYYNYDGFVVLHGTDTMSYTACALSFMFKNLEKPIILTGSQLPIGMVRTDGKENLITAIEIASAKRNNESLVKEVAIYFEYQLFRGNRTTKVSSEHFDAFMSYNYPALAEIGVEIKYNLTNILVQKSKQLTYNKGFNPNVLVVFFYPGIIINQVLKLMKDNSSNVIILYSFGSGNLPSSNELFSFIKDVTNSNKVFLNASQCAAGSVDQNKYEGGRLLRNVGVVGMKDMTIEAIIVKSMFLLNKFPNDKQKFLEFITKDLAGELSE
jgi:L-asparaginase